MPTVLRILLVEDNPGDADLIHEFLAPTHELRFDFINVASLAEAQDAIQGNTFDVAILDLGLPDSVGLETLEAMRTSAPQLPLVVLTGNADEAIAFEALKQGAQDYLIKGEISGQWLHRVLRYAIERQHAEDEVRDSALFLRSTLDSLSANIAILDDSGCILAVNKAWRNFAVENCALMEACGVGVNYLDVCTQAQGNDAPSAAAVAAGIRAVLKGRRLSFESEYPCHSPDEQRWFLVRVTPFPGDGPPRAVVAHENISAMKKAEREVQQRQRILDETGTMAKIGGWEHDLITGRATWTNALYDIIEIPWGTPIPGVEEHLDYYPSDSRKKLEEAYWTAVNEGLAFDLELQVYTVKKKLLWSRVYGEPIIENGKCLRLRGTFQDITDRKEAELARLETERRAQSVMDNLPGMAYRCHNSPGWPTLYVSAGAFHLTGYTMTELRGEGSISYSEIIHPEDRQYVWENTQEQLQQGSLFSLDYRIVKKNGEERWVSEQGMALEMEEGVPSILEGFVADITERKQAQEHIESMARFPAENSNPVMRISQHGILVYANKASAAVLKVWETKEGAPVPAVWKERVLSALESRLISQHEYCCDEIWYVLVLAPIEELRVVNIYGMDITARKKAEDAVRDSEEKYRLLADNTVDCIWLMSLEQVFQYLNPAIEAILGYKPEEMIGRKLGDFTDEANLLIMAQQIRHALEEHPDFEVTIFEAEMIHRDGRSIPVEITGRVLVDTEGRPYGLQGVTRNITERQQARLKLQQALYDTQAREQQIAMLLESAQAVLECQHFEGAARRVFDACREAIGAASGYVVLFSEEDQSYEVLFLEAGGYPCEVDPDLPMPLRGLRAQAYQLCAAVYDNDFQNSAWMEFIPEGHVQLKNVLFAPLLIKGKPVGLLGLANKPGDFNEEDARLAMAFSQQAAIALRNIQDRDALAESELKYRNYVDASPLAIFITNEAGEYIDVNEAASELLGYSREELLALTISEIDSPENALSAPESLKRLEAEGLLNEERTLLCKDGSLVQVSLNATVLPGSRRMAFCSDITARLSLEEQLRQAQKMEAIGRLAGGVAHDFNNILQTMIGYSQMILEELEEDSELYEFAEEISQGTERAAALTRQLLAFSRRQVLKLEDINLNDVVEGIMKMLRRVIGEDIQMHVLTSNRLATVHADRGQVEQILMNLAINARDAMPRGGVLTIETDNVILDSDYCQAHSWASAGRYALLSVTDVGCGMDNETLERIFEPFFTTKELGKGTGLGLSTVHGIVRQHHGLLHVYSEVGKGTTFKIYLPIIERPASQDASELPKAVIGGNETILLVEDDENVRKLAIRVLEHAGYTLLSAENGLKALEAYEGNSKIIDLVLLDVVMPELGGREVYEQLREKDPKLKFLFSSGYSTNAVHTNFVLNEGIEFIQKPYAPDALLRKIREVLEKRGKGNLE